LNIYLFFFILNKNLSLYLVLEKFFVQFIKDEITCDEIKNSYSIIQTGNYLSENVSKLFDEIFEISGSLTTENIKDMIKKGKLTVSIYEIIFFFFDYNEVIITYLLIFIIILFFINNNNFQ